MHHDLFDHTSAGACTTLPASKGNVSSHGADRHLLPGGSQEVNQHGDGPFEGLGPVFGADFVLTDAQDAYRGITTARENSSLLRRLGSAVLLHSPRRQWWWWLMPRAGELEGGQRPRPAHVRGALSEMDRGGQNRKLRCT